MKNKFQFFFIKVGIIFFLLISNSYTETFEFEAENIETINANTGLVMVDGKLIEKPVLRQMQRTVEISNKLKSSRINKVFK